MKRRATFLIFLILMGLTGCSFWEETIHQEKGTFDGQIRDIVVKVNNVDLIIEESKDDQIHARHIGTKAKIDQWDFKALTKGKRLEISSSYAQKMYLNLNDYADRKLIVSLPKKSFHSIQIAVAYWWDDTTVTVLDRTYTTEQLRKLKEQTSPFGKIQFIH